MNLVQCSSFLPAALGLHITGFSSCVFVLSSYTSLQLCLFEDARLKCEYSDKTYGAGVCSLYLFTSFLLADGNTVVQLC